MARSKSKHRRDNYSHNAIAKRSLPVFSYYVSPVPYGVQKSLRQLEDRRTFHPMGRNRFAFGSGSSRNRMIVTDSQINRAVKSGTFRGITPTYPGYRQKFRKPETLSVCVRRIIRKQVIHALGISGKSGGQKRPRFSFLSSISCRR